jgi:tRNA (guanine-N7-)-methyltransferase
LLPAEDTEPSQPTHVPPLIPTHKCELPLALLGEAKDWAAVYGRSAPLAVEIGCGGGRTTIGMALSRPDWNFLACERAGEYYRVLLDRAEKRALPNLRITRTDATYLLARFFPAASVNEYHIYFPDPWPKKRHHKRRLISEGFCVELRRTLVPNGVLYFATDHADYYTELLPRVRATLDVREHPEPWPDAPEGRTNYEIKYLKAGRPIYRFVAVNRPPQ